MRHRRKGRTLGRSPSHRKAMLRNLACSLILTERDEAFYEGLTQPDGKTTVNPPTWKGRVVTTLHKAKEVRPLVEKCVTIAKKALPHEQEARQYEIDADRNSEQWRQWRNSDQWQQWAQAMAPAVAARRRAFQILRDDEAVSILFEDIAPRFADRPGGYTRIMRLAKPRLGDAGTRAILEFVGKHDRVTDSSAAKPAFEDDSLEADDETSADNVAVAEEDEQPVDESPADASEETVAEASDDGSDEGGDEANKA